MTTELDATTIDHPIGADGLLVLHLTDGDVRLTGIDGDRVTIRSSDGDALDRLDVERGERSLAVRQRGRDGRPTSGGVDLTVELPTVATVVVETGAADIVANHLGGDVRLATASGDLSIRDVTGRLAAEAVSGDIQIVARGSIDVVARTVSGDLELRAATIASLRATTTSGDLTIAGRFAGDGPFMIETVSGDASLEPVGDIQVEATTLTGDIHGRGIGHRSSRDPGPIVIGAGGGPTIAFRSTSGDLAITPRADATAEGTTIAESAPAPRAAPDRADPSIDILRALEAGEIDVADARRALAELDAIEPEPSDA